MATLKFRGGMSNAELIKALNDVWDAASVAGSGTGLSASDQLKLNNIQANATANSTDAQLRDRTTHTGLQAITTITGLQTALDAKQASLTLKTINGVSIVGTGDIAIASSGALSTADRLKIDSIASGATANSTDAVLLNRANHNGAQSIITITGLQASLDNKQSVLISTTNIKTLNGESILGPGNLVIGGAGLSAADRLKFDGIAVNATQNQTDSFLTARSNHTGQQALTTVAGLQTALDSKLATTTFKTINSQPITGVGNIVVSGGSGASFTQQQLTHVGNGTTTWNIAIGNIAYLQMTSNTTLAFPTNVAVGPLMLIVDQDATGGRVLSLPATYHVSRMATTVANTRAIYWLVPSFTLDSIWGGPQFEGISLTGGNIPTGNNTIMYPRVLGIYFQSYDPAITILQVPLDFNVIYLFTAVPVGTPAVPNMRDQLGDGSFFLANIGEPQISNDKIQTVRARGQRVILTLGGANNGYSFTTRTQSQNLVNSVQSMYTAIGGFDGIDYNTFEQNTRSLYAANPALHGANVAEIVWQAQQFKALFGTAFSITMPPGTDAFAGGIGGATAFSPLDGLIAQGLRNAGLLTYAMPQFYEFDGFKAVNVVKDYTAEWVTNMGNDQSSIGLGLSMHRFNDSLTLAECQRELSAVLTQYPNIRGVYGWNAQANHAGGNVWGAAMRQMLGLPLVTPNSGGGSTAPQESALTAAMAYNGGQNGGWYDITTAYLEGSAGPGTVTTNGQLVTKIVDRSGNTNHLLAAATTSGDYVVAGPNKSVHTAVSFTSSTGGGAGDTNSAGFFMSYVFRIQTDYPYLWSDNTTANNGRYILYEAYLGQLTFSVGTGATRVAVYSQTLAAINIIPNINVHVTAWQDATHIYLQVNGGPVSSVACAATTAGSLHCAIAGAQIASPGYNECSIYYGFHTLNPLTPALRDGVNAFVATKKP